MRNRVLAVDPGGTNGWATWTPSFHGCGQEADFKRFTRLVDDLAPELEVIVAERFTITAETLRKSRQNAALEVIGFLHYVSVREGVELVLQAPGDAKRFATDDRLRSAGWRQPSSQDHANDALRHLLLYLVKAGHVEVPR
jgi:hypothetical protein